MTPVSIPYAPRPLQRRFHESARRFSVAVCHRRFGKTVMAVNHLLRRVLTCRAKRPQGAYIAPTLVQAKKIAWEYCKEYAGVLPGVTFNERELRTDLPNGGRIWLLGSENPDALRGLYLDFVVFDEYADIDPRLYPEVVRPALADRRGGALWIGTPRGHNQFWRIYEQARRERAAGSSDWYVCLHRASETGILPAEELRAARRAMTPEQYAQEFECSFTAAIVGAYYGRLLAEAERDGRITRVPWEPTLPVHTAWDLGISDSTAIWFFQVHGGVRRYIDYYEAAGEGLVHYAKVLSQKPYAYGEHLQPHDIMVRELGTGRSRYEMLRSLGIRCRVAPDIPVQDGIEAARMVLRTCWFDAERCRRGLEALRQYRRAFDPRRQDFGDRPLHDWTSHAADAFRISVVGMRAAPAEADLAHVARTGRLPGGGAAVIAHHAALD